jgi:hypothetical protein
VFGAHSPLVDAAMRGISMSLPPRMRQNAAARPRSPAGAKNFPPQNHFAIFPP